MENIYEKVDEGNLYEKPYERPDSPVEPKYENQGAVYETPSEVTEAIYSEIVMQATEEEKRSSPDYMDTRENVGEKDQPSKEHSSSSSSSSSDNEDEKTKDEKVEKVETIPEVAAVETAAVVVDATVEVNGEAAAASSFSRRLSAASSASSASLKDPCDDPPIQLEDDNAEDGMLMAYSHTEPPSEPEEIVDYSLKTLESVTLDENSVAAETQPEISLFVKVRMTEYTPICCESKHYLKMVCIVVGNIFCG